jgi:hypothetical protein
MAAEPNRSPLALVPVDGGARLEVLTERVCRLSSEATRHELDAMLDAMPAAHHAGQTAAADQTKRLANLRARCALQGVELHVIDGDDGKPLYIATKWALTASFDNLASLAAWVARVDGKRE